MTRGRREGRWPWLAASKCGAIVVNVEAGELLVWEQRTQVPTEVSG